MILISKPADVAKNDIRGIEFVRQRKISHCLFLIHVGDHIDDAKGVREFLLQQHKMNPLRKISLVDLNANMLVYFGPGAGNIQSIPLEDQAIQLMKNALSIMNDERNKHKIWAIRHGYDYTWIWLTIKSGLVQISRESWDPSAKSFLDFIKGLDFNNTPDDSGLNKKKMEIVGMNNTFPWKFVSSVDPYEVRRRNEIARKFMALMDPNLL